MVIFREWDVHEGEGWDRRSSVTTGIAFAFMLIVNHLLRIESFIVLFVPKVSVRIKTI